MYTKGKFSIADEPTSCGEVSRKSVHADTANKELLEKLDAKYNGRSLLHLGHCLDKKIRTTPDWLLLLA